MSLKVKELMEKLRSAMAENDPHRNDEPGAPWFRDFVAKEAAAIAPFSAKECETLCKKAGIEYMSGYESRIVQFVYTDGTIDRYGDKILAKGVKLDKYKTNPIILGFHNSHTFPIGASLKVWYDKPSDSVKGWVLFLDERVDKSGFADSMFRMVKAGVVKTGSIGFIPLKFRRPDEEERTKLGIGEYGYLFEEVELIEFSIVPLPANPSAMMEPVTKGLLTERAMQTIEERKFFNEEDTAKLREAYSKSFANGGVVTGNATVSATVGPETVLNVREVARLGEILRTTPEARPDTSSAVPVALEVKSRSAITFNFVGTVKEIEALLKISESYKADYDITANVTIKEGSANGTQLQEVYELMKDIKSKRLVTKEQKNAIQDCLGHIESVMTFLQELLDASPDEEEGEEGKGAPVATELPPVGGNKEAQGLYSPAFLKRIEDKTTEIANLRKG